MGSRPGAWQEPKALRSSYEPRCKTFQRAKSGDEHGFTHRKNCRTPVLATDKQLRSESHLTASDVVALAELFFETLGYARPTLRADGLGRLESAIYRAQTTAYYGGADLVLQAAALCHGILTNDAFVDGNKRAAWIATVTFLSDNGRDLPDNSAVALADRILMLYDQEDHSKIVEQLAEWLRAHLTHFK